MISKEKERILTGNIAPMNRLFDLGSVEVFEQHNLVMDSSGIKKMGQQDCKDFFICLSENRHHWTDVYSLFMVNSISFTTCSSCNHVSTQDHNLPERTFFLFECPITNVTMSSFIEGKMNTYEEIKNWRDEDGCKQKSAGRNSTRIQDINKTENLIFILSRLIRIDGNLEIIDKKVPLGGNISINDVNGQSSLFMPIAIIHHSGEVIDNTTRGHYQADVLDKFSNHWIRTSDDAKPERITRRNITDQGYIYLYKKIK